MIYECEAGKLRKLLASGPWSQDNVSDIFTALKTLMYLVSVVDSSVISAVAGHT